jgi:hypothetical protein
MSVTHNDTVEARQISVHFATCTDTGETVPEVISSFLYTDLSKAEMDQTKDSVEFTHHNES